MLKCVVLAIVPAYQHKAAIYTTITGHSQTVRVWLGSSEIVQWEVLRHRELSGSDSADRARVFDGQRCGRPLISAAAKGKSADLVLSREVRSGSRERVMCCVVLCEQI